MTDCQKNPALTSAFRIRDAINSRNLTGLEELFTEDFLDLTDPSGSPRGVEGYMKTLEHFARTLGMHVEEEAIIETPDRIIARVTEHGKGVASIHGEEAAGRPYTIDAVHIFHTRGDLIAAHWGLRNSLDMLIQLGLIEPPPGRK
ncbi:MAG: ester cyclase [Corynebacterium humireducens]|jgi:predicted ester cyclase|uniref:Ester cyclase n=1 Tax=Corynebacterium humireducens TaxID=1223514 RepID=A0A7X6SV34_9CORY|nr:ester cyclase [Corynebacterium humireducens]